MSANKIRGYSSEGTFVACEDDPDYINKLSGKKKELVKPETIEDFGADFEPLPTSESYYPTRLEYFAGKALQGLVTGRAQKDLNNTSNIARTAVMLAEALEREVDSTED